MSTILVVDDEKMIRLAFSEFLKDAGYTALLAENAASALAQIKRHKPQIVFLDYRMPGTDGLELLTEIKKTNQDIAVIFMTAFGAMDVAIKAMQSGAHEYLTKPLDLDKIKGIIQRILENKKKLESLNENNQIPPISLDKIVGRSPAMQKIFKMIGLLSTQDVTVLVTGESGVGKELVARAIHDNSARRDQPFVAVNCGAIPENLIESELFGNEEGAFTGANTRRKGKFEAAGKGTIFLDEIGELQLSLQVKMLRVLQERTLERVGGTVSIPVEARIIAATNKNLHQEIMAGRFRNDLFYRLNLVHVKVPALRERREDIALLVHHFISKVNQEEKRHVVGIEDDVLQDFQNYSWPGNVRELENRIRRAMILSRENILTANLFELRELHESEDYSATSSLSETARKLFNEIIKKPGDTPLMEHAVSLVEKAIIQEALSRCKGNQVHTAKLLGIHRSTLRKKINDYKL